MAEQLGRYTLVRKLAEGATGDVFLAKAEGPGGFAKSLVIKRIAPVLVAQGQFVQNFLHEARISAKLDHPNVVQLFDFGEASGRYFLAMEHLEGATARAILEKASGKRLPIPIAARLVTWACEGVAFAHELNVVHGNLCPEHLMVTRTGGVKVLDFGVSRVANQALGFTPGGRLVYQPVEQVLGELDLRADVFALGAILYELTSGATPYPEMPDAKLKKAITNHTPIPLQQQAPDLDPAFVAVVEKAMAREADDRFPNCRELAQALDDYLKAKKIRVGTPQLAELVNAADSIDVDIDDDGAAPAAPPPPRPEVFEEGEDDSALLAAAFDDLPAGLSELIDDAPIAEDKVRTSGRSSTGSDRPGLFGGIVSVNRAPIPEAPSPFMAVASVKSAPIPEPPSPFMAVASVNASPRTALPEPPSPFSRGPRSAPPPPAGGGGFFDALPPAPAAPKPGAPIDPETRSQAVLAAAKAMRMYEAGPALGTPAELDAVRQELEREDGAALFVRFALQAGRLHQANPELGELISDKLVGVVEGLLIAEAYTPLAQLFDRLEPQAREDVEARWVLDALKAALLTPTQAFRLAARLKELAPADASGLGRVIGLFPGDYANLWIGFYEAMELPGSREAMQPGLAVLAGKNPRAFLSRIEVKRPKRLSEFVYFLEKGRGSDRMRVFRELMARPEPVRRRDVLAGMAQAGTEDGLRLCVQALSESDEELRVHAMQLIAKHFTDKALTLLAPVMDDSYDDRSQVERTALWRALGATNHPDLLGAFVEVLKRKPTLMNRGKVEQRKLDALEGLAEMKRPEVADLLEATFADRSQPEPVRASAQRLLAAVRKLHVDEHVEARRWERTPSTFLDVALDLFTLSSAARLVEATSPALEVGFTRLHVRLEHLLAQGGRVTFGLQGRVVMVNGEALTLPEGDPSMSRVESAWNRRGVLSFTFNGVPSIDELQQLVRWLAQGPGARTFTARRIERTPGPGFEPPPEQPKVPMPTLSEPSREAMVRYADLVLGLRTYLVQKSAVPPELRVPLHELAMILHTRSVRFAGLLPAQAGQDALLFHTVNAAVLSLGFAAELGLSRDRIVSLAELALYPDAGQLLLPEDTLLGRRPASREELAGVRKSSLRLPLVRSGDAPSAARWASVVVDQERSGSEQSLLGGIVALSRLWEGLTSTQTPEAALEQLTTKHAPRFRPELMPLFVRYVKRQSLRVLPPPQRGRGSG